MSIGYGIAAFTDGFFKGKDWRDAREEKKYNRARQERLDKLAEQYDTLRIQELGLSIEDKKRARETDQQNRDFFANLPNTAPASVTVPAQELGLSMGSAPVVSATAQPATAPAPARPQLGFGAIGAVPAIGGGAGADALQGGGGSDRIAVTPQSDFLSPTGDGRFFAARPPRDAAEKQKLAELAKAGRLAERPQTVRNQPAIDAMGLPPQTLGQQISNATAPVRNTAGRVLDVLVPSRNTPENAGQSLREGIDRAAGAVGAVKQGVVGANAGALGVVASALGAPEAGQAMIDFAQDRGSAAQTMLRDGADMVPAGQKPQSPETTASPVDAPSPAAAASTQATTAAIGSVAKSFGMEPMGDPMAMGLKASERFTQKQVQSAAEATLKWYNETAAPQILQHYVSTGQIDKATAFADLLETQAGKKAMERRASAAFKAINGDIDGYANDILEAYKAYGYVDPTFDIDEEATSIIRDENGNFTGAKLVMKDRKTGNMIETMFATQEELIQYGLMSTDPATMVELMTAQKPEAKGAITEQDIMKTATDIMKSASDMGRPITPEQAIAQATALAQAAKGATLGTVGASQGLRPEVTGVGEDGLYSLN